eukprot:361392_1
MTHETDQLNDYALSWTEEELKSAFILHLQYKPIDYEKISAECNHSPEEVKEILTAIGRCLDNKNRTWLYGSTEKAKSWLNKISFRRILLSEQREIELRNKTLNQQILSLKQQIQSLKQQFAGKQLIELKDNDIDNEYNLTVIPNKDANKEEKKTSVFDDNEDIADVINKALNYFMNSNTKTVKQVQQFLNDKSISTFDQLCWLQLNDLNGLWDESTRYEIKK